MTFKPIRVKFEEIWPQLKEVSEKIITLSEVDQETWKKCILNVFELCTAYPTGFDFELYEEVKKFLEEHVRMLCENMKSSEDFLVAYENSWNIYEKGIKQLHALYVYYNTHSVKLQKTPSDYSHVIDDPCSKMLQVEELGMEIWSEQVIKLQKEQLTQLLLNVIRNDRSGISENSSAAFHGVVDSFIKIEETKRAGFRLYQTIVEEPYLAELREYYKINIGQLMQENNCSQFMLKVLQTADEEKLRRRKYLHESSTSKVSTAHETLMIRNNLKYLYEESKTMVREENKQDLQMLYRILKPVVLALDDLITNVQEHITKMGHVAINSSTDDASPEVFVDTSYKFYIKYLDFLNETFDSDKQLVGALDKACVEVINCKENPNLASKRTELLARYCESLLRKKSKGLSEADIEDKLSQAIKIFSYVDDKDLFQKIYGRSLARRLITSTSASMDTEEFVIKKLRDTCGFDFTKDMHSIFTGVTMSKGMNEKFTDFLKVNDVSLGLAFNAIVFQSSTWPMSSLTPSFAIPQVFEKGLQKFELFYSTAHNGRKLTWMHNLGVGEVKLCYMVKPCIVTMSSYQMAIFLLFQEADYLTFSEISESTKLKGELLTRNIESLVDAKLLMPADESGNSNIADGLIKLNLEYTSKRAKVKVAPARLKREAEVEMQKVHESVEDHRKMHLEAAIVRIAKSRRVVKHNVLIEEVIKQVHQNFSPKIPLIKKCILSLTNKAYLQISTENPDEYIYLT